MIKAFILTDHGKIYDHTLCATSTEGLLNRVKKHFEFISKHSSLYGELKSIEMNEEHSSLYIEFAENFLNLDITEIEVY